MSDNAFVHATPFHARAAAANRHNRWEVRNGFTLAQCFADTSDEALVARTRVAMADISWRWRIVLEGDRAEELLACLVTKDAGLLVPGAAFKALWLNDGGAVRGAGVVARFSEENFLIASAAPDAEWISRVALQFGVAMRDVTQEQGGVAVVGPYARAVLDAAGLQTDLEALSFRKLFWRGLDVTLSRWGELGGYEIWCNADDGLLVWDRIARAGGAYGIQPAGLAAMDILDCEAGIARPLRDYTPARDGFAKSPTPRSLDLEKLIDAEHGGFNGRPAWMATRDSETRTIAGVETDGATPAPFTPLLQNGRAVGHTLTSHYSPALRCAIALAQVEISAAQAGTVFSLSMPPSMDTPELRSATARIASLPFLPALDFIAA